MRTYIVGEKSSSDAIKLVSSYNSGIGGNSEKILRLSGLAAWNSLRRQNLDPTPRGMLVAPGLWKLQNFAALCRIMPGVSPLD